MLLSLFVIQWYYYLQNADISTTGLHINNSLHATSFQASTSLYRLLTYENLVETKAMSSLMASLVFSLGIPTWALSGKPQLLSITSSYLQNQYYLGVFCIIYFNYKDSFAPCGTPIPSANTKETLLEDLVSVMLFSSYSQLKLQTQIISMSCPSKVKV